LRPALFFWATTCALLFFGALFSVVHRVCQWRNSASRKKIGSKKSVLGPATQMSTPTNLIQLSFELAAERCRDLTPAVYRRLYREHPEAEAMFRREAGDRVKGSMLAMAIDAMIDFAGDRKGSFRMIECEVQSHDAYGTPRKLFGDFFGVIAETMREILGKD